MRFLCFHGTGTNAQIFEKQTGKSSPISIAQGQRLLNLIPTARLREALGRRHKFVFVNATSPATPAAGTEFASGGSYSFRSKSLTELRVAYDDLAQFIMSNGPFDGVVGFSEGGAVAAGLLIKDTQQPFPQFKCGIFFCAATPVDPDILITGVERTLDVSMDGIVVNVPTAHIWSQAGTIYPGMGQSLRLLCNEAMRDEFIHHLGHEIPGSRSDDCLTKTVLTIERTIERAMT